MMNEVEEQRSKIIVEIINNSIEPPTEEINGFPIEEDFNPANPDSFLVFSDSYSRINDYYELISAYPKAFSPKEYWYGLRSAYTLSDNLYESKDLVNKLFTANIPNKEYLMNPEERLILKNLEKNVTIYRGMSIKEFENGGNHPSKFGLSWTLSKGTAEFFANKYIRNIATQQYDRKVVTKVVSKDKILAYFADRKEEEVIVTQ